ncbi:MAG TPA: hypothetical protein VGO03_13875 [Acidimicrobiia bacterium]|jgi:membrane-bound metal-dependent hydrolase YbcI (DUF457 family)
MKALVHYLPWFILGVVGSVNWLLGTVGAVVALLVVAIASRPHRLGVFDVATLVFFAAVALHAAVWPNAGQTEWLHPISTAWMCVVALATVACGRPFTIDYANLSVPATVAASPAFVAANRAASLWWAAAFAVIASDGALAIVVDHKAIGTAVAVVAVLGAARASKQIAVASVRPPRHEHGARDARGL